MSNNLLKRAIISFVFLLFFVGFNISSDNDLIKLEASEIASVSYQTHVQKVGWQDYVADGMSAGTSGQALRLEGIKIRLDNVSGGIEYSTHVQSIGWQDYVSNDLMSGTSGRALRLEAIKIRLTGEAEQLYDVYYRVHTQSYGWLNWAKNDNPAGTAGYSFRLEAIQIMLVPKYGEAPGSTLTPFHEAPPMIKYQTHVEKIGWQGYVNEGVVSGTSGKALRLEGIKIRLDNIKDGIEYSTHVQSIGWQEFVSDNQMSGTSGRALRLEGIKIRLTGEAANRYHVYYRVHAEKFGWMGWAKDGEAAGTEGYKYRLEAIQIVLVPLLQNAPGSTKDAFIKFDLKDHLTRKFSSLDTEIGTTYFTFNTIKNTSIDTPWDYIVHVDFDSDFFWFKLKSIEYSEDQRNITKEQLKAHQKRIADEVIRLLPGKKFTGGYYHGWYRYPTIKVDYISRRYYSWSNFDFNSGGYYDHQASYFRWNPNMDDQL